MSELKRWSIRSVPTDVIRGFRTVAFDNDLTIAQVLEEAFETYVETAEDEQDSNAEARLWD